MDCKAGVCGIRLLQVGGKESPKGVPQKKDPDLDLRSKSLNEKKEGGSSGH